MEILARMMTRADSGTGFRQRAGPSVQDSFNFDEVMEDTLGNTESKPPGTNNKSDTAVVEKDIPAKPNTSDEDTAGNGALVAGALGNQNMVVFILEGDKESATTPDITADAAAPAEPGVSKSRTVPVGYEFTVTPDAEPFVVNTEHEEPAANAARAGEAPEAAIKEESFATAYAKTAAGPDTAGNENAAGSIKGDVTARMPIERTSERQENEDDNPEFSGKGNLSPLENENDATPVKGQKAKTYPETESTVRNAAAGVPETANTTPMPLAEGIKPEQFKANQQMRQSAPVKAENLFEEMVSRIETIKSDNRSSMSIQLKPEFLGKVALEIAMDATGLHVKINAEDSGIRTMINGQINTLIESLENKGIEVVEVEVAYTGVDNGSFKESREDQAQSSNRPRRSYREAKAVDGAIYYSALSFDTLDYYLDTGVSSVEYRA